MLVVDEYDSLTNGCGFVRLPRRTLLELTGTDRRKFLHNFCTADVNSLDDGATTEAFVLNGKGKVSGHVLLISFSDRLLMSGSGNQAATLVEHLDRYIIREDVSIADNSVNTACLFVCGKKAGEKIFEISNVNFEIQKASVVTITDIRCVVVRAEIAGDGFLLIADESKIDELADQLTDHGLVNCSLATLEIVRMENGTPWYGREIDNSNLPQELDRDEKTISFTKGCYLGQETVARIDSLGHVNRLLRRLSIKSDDVPEVGSEILDGDNVVGKVLTVVRAHSLNNCLAMAFLKRGASDVGRELKVADCDAVVL